MLQNVWPKTYFVSVCAFVCVQDVEEILRVRQQSRAWCWCMCLGLALMLSGVVVGGAYLYRYYILEVRENALAKHKHPYTQV